MYFKKPVANYNCKKILFISTMLEEPRHSRKNFANAALMPHKTI